MTNYKIPRIGGRKPGVFRRIMDVTQGILMIPVVLCIFIGLAVLELFTMQNDDICQ